MTLLSLMKVNKVETKFISWISQLLVVFNVYFSFSSVSLTIFLYKMKVGCAFKIYYTNNGYKILLPYILHVHVLSFFILNASVLFEHMIHVTFYFFKLSTVCPCTIKNVLSQYFDQQILI